MELIELVSSVITASRVVELSRRGNTGGCEITGMTLDSCQVEVGDVFLAFPGTLQDGCQYIQDALSRGAAAVLYEEGQGQQVAGWIGSLDAKTAPLIPMVGLRDKVSSLASHFYSHPSRDITIIGVTGTNGKTSFVQFLSQVCNVLGIPCGVMGTLGVGWFSGRKNVGLTRMFHGTSGLTTPDAVTVQRELAALKAKGVKVVAMEVTSHALVQGRVKSVAFDAAVFTNVSQDHFDYHGNLANYKAAKQCLFTDYPISRAVLNLDDDFGRELATKLSDTPLRLCGYQVGLPDGSYLFDCLQGQLLAESRLGFVASVQSPQDEGEFMASLLGGVINLSNLLAVLGVLHVFAEDWDIDWQRSLKALSSLRPVPGRLEPFGGDNGNPLLIVDYAHTPDALDRVLQALRKICCGQLWCVFGCGGDRDVGKRSLMGQAAELEADRVVITDDNPRTENPQKIIDDILAGLQSPECVKVLCNRAEAIQYVLKQALSDDVVLIAGKGCEDYPLIGISGKGV